MSQEAYDRIKRQIIELELPPGAGFTEGQIAADLGLSKTPAREALGRLQLEGLVEVMARSGYRVAPVTIKSARDLLDVRELLETKSAELAAAASPSEEQLEELKSLSSMTYTPGDRQSTRAFLQANTQFHVALARCGGNERLAEFLEQVLDQLERLFHLKLRISASPEEVTHEHWDLLQAVLEGDAERAVAVTRTQAAVTRRTIMTALLSSDVVLSVNVGLSAS